MCYNINEKERVLSKKIHLAALSILIICFCCNKTSENEMLLSYAKKEYPYVQKFLDEYPEENLLTVMNFADNANRYFDEIKDIPELFAYFQILDFLATDDDRFSKKWIGNVIEYNFNEKNLTEKRAEILTYLLLESDGYSAELIADEYTKLFSKSSAIFLKVLSKNTNWKRVADALGAGDWSVFEPAVKKLGDSGFEGEFKRYALAPAHNDLRENL